MNLPEFSGLDDQPIIKAFRVCYVDREHTNTVFLRLRHCLGCVSCGFPGASADDIRPLKFTQAVLQWGLEPHFIGRFGKPKEESAKVRWALPIDGWYLFIFIAHVNHQGLRGV